MSNSKSCVPLTPSQWARIKAIQPPAGRMVHLSKPLITTKNPITKVVTALVSPARGNTFELPATKAARTRRMLLRKGETTPNVL